MTKGEPVLQLDHRHGKLTLIEERKWERLTKTVAVMARSFMIAVIANVDGIGRKIRKKTAGIGSRLSE